MLGWVISYCENQQRVMPLLPFESIMEGSDLKLEQSLAGLWDKCVGRSVTSVGVGEAGTG